MVNLPTIIDLTLPHFRSRRYNIQNKINFSYTQTVRVSNNKKNAHRKENFLVLYFS